MNIKEYKQYLDNNYNCRMICGLKESSPRECYELIDSDYLHSVDMFRPMTLSILAYDESAGDIGEFVDTSTVESEYLKIFLGKKPEWKVVNVFLYSTGALIYYYRYDDEGRVKKWTSVELSVPARLTFQVDLGDDGAHPQESYIVTMEQDAAGNAAISYEYLQNGHRLYSSKIGEDERGTYEIIKED